MTKFFVSTLLIVSLQTFLSLSEIEGKWKGFVESEIGDFPISVEYSVEGQDLSGVFENSDGPVSFDGGKIIGNHFEYQCTDQGYTFTHKGVVQGDTIHLIWHNEALGEGKGLLIRR